MGRDDSFERISVSESAHEIALKYEIRAELEPLLETALAEAKEQRGQVDIGLREAERLAELRKPFARFFRAMRHAAESLQSSEVAESDLRLFSERISHAVVYCPDLKFVQDGKFKYNQPSAQDFRDLLQNVANLGSLENFLQELTINHDKRMFREVVVWNNCLDPIFNFWRGPVGRTIENYFNDDGVRRAEMEDGEPISEGARFIADCMQVIDARGYTHERLMRLLDTRRK